MNPYRDRFYNKQAKWYGDNSGEEILISHGIRAKHFNWYTRGWLPDDTSSPILDIGCGAGQFVFFLKEKGYSDVTGIDIDKEQIRKATDMGLNCKVSTALEFLKDKREQYACIAMLDIIEHFTLTELVDIMDIVRLALKPGGSVIVSVPNATSPRGLSTRYGDITHEQSFTPTSLKQMFFCHDLKIEAMRDPWPAPVSFTRIIYRVLVMAMRRIESLRLKLLGLESPKIWSPVMWAKAR